MAECPKLANFFSPDRCIYQNAITLRLLVACVTMQRAVFLSIGRIVLVQANVDFLYFPFEDAFRYIFMIDQDTAFLFHHYFSTKM